MANCWDFFCATSSRAPRAAAIMGEWRSRSRASSRATADAGEPRSGAIKVPQCDQYQREHDLLFDAIRNDKPYNETERAAKACLVAIMGRMAAESGLVITCDEALASNLELAPGLDQINSLDAPAPVTPDAAGKYPVPVPGRTKVL